MIVQAAVPLITEYGSAVTTAKIARAAGIGEGTIFASLAGWALLATPERFGVRHARAIRIGVAVAVLAVSLLPLAGDGMDGGTRTALTLMHLAVAAALIPGLTGRPPAHS
ncbi:DUF6069 family protein [Streptomyces cellulosae]